MKFSQVRATKDYRNFNFERFVISFILNTWNKVDWVKGFFLSFFEFSNWTSQFLLCYFVQVSFEDLGSSSPPVSVSQGTWYFTWLNLLIYRFSRGDIVVIRGSPIYCCSFFPCSLQFGPRHKEPTPHSALQTCVFNWSYKYGWGSVRSCQLFPSDQ
jgi:hypothetical protein